jgi:hypothetical protein
MSIVIPKFDRSVVVRGAAAEVVGAATAKIKLLADSSTTGGAPFRPSLAPGRNF